MHESVNQFNHRQVSRGALERNARAICDYVQTRVIGVLKCDGYGVSIPEAARAWQSAGVDMLAVSQPDEALTLRQTGFDGDILLLAPVADAAAVQVLTENQVILTVSSLENARFYLQNEQKPVRVHVAVDTGMGRFGIRWTDPEQLKQIYALEGLQVEGIFSHFARAFEKKYSFTEKQLQRFLQAVDALTQSGIAVGMRHIANSCAALRFPQTRLDAVRIGSALTGALIVTPPIKLERAAVFRAQVVDVRQMLPGDTTGYAAICKIKKPTKAVVVAIGSACGFGDTGLPDKFRLLDLLVYLKGMVRSYLHLPSVNFNGKDLPLIGRVGTQYTLFDATGVDIAAGDYVTARVSLLFPVGRRIIE